MKSTTILPYSSQNPPRAQDLFQEDLLSAIQRHVDIKATAASVDLSREFDIPEPVTKLITSNVMSRSDFLSRVPVHIVEELKGTKLSFSLNPMPLKRSNQGSPREPSISATTNTQTYELVEIESDFFISDLKTRAYAKFDPNGLRKLLTDAAFKEESNGYQWLGFHGISEVTDTGVVAKTNKVTKGWLQKVKDNKAANYLEEVIANKGKIIVGSKVVNLYGDVTDAGSGKVEIKTFGAHHLQGLKVLIKGTDNYNGVFEVDSESPATAIQIPATHATEKINVASAEIDGDYQSLDSLVQDMITLIPEGKRGDLEVFTGYDLLSDRIKTVFDAQKNTPTERGAVQSQKFSFPLALHPASSPDFFPANTIMVTDIKNLSIYQHKYRKTFFEYSATRKGEIYWNIVQMAYEVEDYDRIAVARNVHVLS